MSAPVECHREAFNPLREVHLNEVVEKGCGSFQCYYLPK